MEKCIACGTKTVNDKFFCCLPCAETAYRTLWHTIQDLVVKVENLQGQLGAKERLIGDLRQDLSKGIYTKEEYQELLTECRDLRRQLKEQAE